MTRRRALPFAVVAALGLGLAVLQFVLDDDRDPLVFTIPILVLTLITLGVMAIAGRGAEPAWADDAVSQGLQDDGIRPLPPVTPILADVRQPTRVLSGQLYDGGPWVRIARIHGEIVAITDAPADEIDPDSDEWLAHRGGRAGIAEGLLVVALPDGTMPHDVLAATRELHARL